MPTGNIGVRDKKDPSVCIDYQPAELCRKLGDGVKKAA
jgi:hypothetical protein